MPKSRMALLGLGLLPLAIAAAVIVGVIKLSDYEHANNLPDGYERMERGRFEVHYPRGLRGEASRVVDAAEVFIELAVESMSPLLGDLTPPTGPFRLTLFADRADFERFASATLDDDMSHNGGYFDTMTLEIVLVMSEVESETGMGIRHEVAHMLVGRGGGRYGTKMPAWLHEGLATYLETADPKRPGDPARVAQWVRMVSAVNAPPTVAEIVGANRRAFSGEGNDVYYAYSNLLVHFLMRRSADRFWRFARAAREGRDLDLDGLLKHFGPHDLLEAAWTGAMEAARTQYATELGERIDRLRKVQ